MHQCMFSNFLTVAMASNSRKNYYEIRLSTAKGCKTMKVEIEVQVPTAVYIGPLTLSACIHFFQSATNRATMVRVNFISGD